DLLGVLADLDQQQLVVGPARREGGGREASVATDDLPPAQHVPVEGRRALEVVDVEDEMTELLDFHTHLLRTRLLPAPATVSRADRRWSWRPRRRPAVSTTWPR